MKASPQTLYQKKFVLDDSYELTSSVRHSKRSVVYRATCLPTVPIRDFMQRQVALKLILHDNSEEAVKAVLREAELTQSLNSDKIVSLHDYLARSDLCYLVYELAPCGDVRQLLDTYSKPMPLGRAFGFAEQLLKGLSYLHDHGIVHRDIKPSNLLLWPNSKVKIGDFGIACEANKEGVAIDAPGVGTLDYLAPEQLQFGMSSFASDLYAAAVTIFEIFTGHLPIESMCFADGINARLNHDFTNVSDYRNDCCEELEAVLNKALAVEPGMRFQTVQEFLLALQAVKETIPAANLTLCLDPAFEQGHDQENPDSSEHSHLIELGKISMLSFISSRAMSTTVAAVVLLMLFVLEIGSSSVFAQGSAKTSAASSSLPTTEKSELRPVALSAADALLAQPFSGISHATTELAGVFQIATIPQNGSIRVVLFGEGTRDVDFSFNPSLRPSLMINGVLCTLTFDYDVVANDMYAVLTHKSGIERIRMSPFARAAKGPSTNVSSLG